MEWISKDGKHIFHNRDNKEYFELAHLYGDYTIFDLVYADMMYDDMDFDRWLPNCRDFLHDAGSIFVQTDYRSVAELKLYMDGLFGKENFVNWIVWPYDWGGRAKNAFGRKHDDILWYSKTSNYVFYPEHVGIPKKTAKSAFNKSGRSWKIPTDVWGDIGNFHTMATERVSGAKWQKPERLIRRIIEATTKEGDYIFDPFAGVGTTLAVAIKTGRISGGCEIDKEIWKAGVERLKNVQPE